MNREEDLKAGCGCCGPVDRGRRQTLGLVVATGLAASIPIGRGAWAQDAQDPSKAPPQPGDELVFVKGDRKYEAITAADLAEADTALEAWPKEAASDTVRRRSRLNRVLLLKLDPATLDEATAAQGVDGILAFSAFCTHAGCFIENYRAEEQAIYCHCHNSMFDPRADGKVLSGPAQMPLARLPIKLDGDKLVVAAAFEGTVGMKQA